MKMCNEWEVREGCLDWFSCFVVEEFVVVMLFYMLELNAVIYLYSVLTLSN